MFIYRTQETTPHLVIEMAGVVEMTDVDAVAFGQDLKRMNPGYVLRMDHAKLSAVTPEAVGVMYYLAQHVFAQKPGLVVMVNGGRTVHPRLRGFIERLDEGGCMHIVATNAQADALLQAHTAARP